MSEGTLKYSIPRIVEPRRFAQLGVKLSGFVPVELLNRLIETGVEAERIHIDFEFDVDEGKAKVVTGVILADVFMQCQRCLEPVKKSLECAVSTAIVWNEDAVKTLSASLEPWIVPQDEADLYAMIEDEILLNLPFVAYHDEPCVDSARLSVGAPAGSQDTEENNPFQVLRQLQLKETTKK